MAEADLLTIADELYGLTLPDFTPARDARAKELKGADKELSAQVKALKKPSVAAWVVNVLVRHETEQVDQVLAVGVALREAQAGMSGEELRALTRQRRQLTAAVTTQARRLAGDLGTKVTSAVADQVEATLTAAMIDEGCAQAVRSGQLLTALSATGVDEVDLAAAVATPEALGFEASTREPEPEAKPDLHVVPDPEADAKAVKAAEKALAEKRARARQGDEGARRRRGRRRRARGPEHAGPGRDRRAAPQARRARVDASRRSRRSSPTPRTCAPRPRAGRPPPPRSGTRPRPRWRG